MNERDQAVCLAAAKAGVETENRRGRAVTGKATENLPKQLLEAGRRISVREEPACIDVVGRSLAREHRPEASRELSLRQAAFENVLPWLAAVENRRRGHVVTCSGGARRAR